MYNLKKKKRNNDIIYLPPCFHNHPSLSGLKKVCMRSLPSSSGILNGSVFIDSYSDWKDKLKGTQ